jgi:hypothetical protein
MTMKTLVSALLALSVLAGVVTPASAYTGFAGSPQAYAPYGPFYGSVPPPIRLPESSPPHASALPMPEIPPIAPLSPPPAPIY